MSQNENHPSRIWDASATDEDPTHSRDPTEGVGSQDDEDSYVGEEEIDEVIELDELDAQGWDDGMSMLDDDASMMDRGEYEYEEGEEGEDDGAGQRMHPEEEAYEDHAKVVFDQHQEPVYAVACHPTNPYAVSGGGDDSSYLWHLTEGRVLHTHKAQHTDSVVSVGFNFDGTLYASAGMDQRVFVYDTQRGEEVARFEAGDEVLWLDWHPRGNALVAGTNDGQLWLWHVPTQTVMQVLHGVHVSPVSCGQFTPCGKRVVSGSDDGSFAVWDPQTGQHVVKFTVGSDPRWLGAGDDGVTALGVHPALPLVLVGARSGVIKLVHLHQTQVLASLDAHTQSVECARFSPTLALAATASVDGYVALVDTQRTCVRARLAHPAPVPTLAWTPRGCVVTACMDARVRVFDARAATLVYTLAGHTHGILAMALGGGGRVLTGSDDGTCRVFEIPGELAG